MATAGPSNGMRTKFGACVHVVGQVPRVVAEQARAQGRITFQREAPNGATRRSVAT